MPAMTSLQLQILGKHHAYNYQKFGLNLYKKIINL